MTDRFHLHKGEILGFAGLVGSGRTETVSALIGAGRCHRKRVRLGGQPAALRSPAQALAQGIGLLPESRKTEGLVLPFSVAQNITSTGTTGAARSSSAPARIATWCSG